ncbi:glutathione binding-like protein [Methylorubrum aminovorans]|uniref:glutathione binding-like protein n=1 Tax=Methylorubrum aminovorans TaxID=269069 RepID=UPI003D66CE89
MRSRSSAGSGGRSRSRPCQNALIVVASVSRLLRRYRLRSRSRGRSAHASRLGCPDQCGDSLARARQTVRSHFSNLDGALGDRTWIAGEQRSVADAYLFVLLRWYEDLGLNLQHFENLSRVFDCRRGILRLRALREERSGRRETFATAVA